MVNIWILNWIPALQNGFEYEIETGSAELIQKSRLCAITL